MKLIQFLNSSAAAPEFRAAVESFLGNGHASDRLDFAPNAPTIKIERTLAKVLESYPEVPIEWVRIEGLSGCSTFRGSVKIRTSHDERTILFDWDCRWKAEEMGWVDYFGFPDQTRAAREFGHDCFREWVERETVILDADGVATT